MRLASAPPAQVGERAVIVLRMAEGAPIGPVVATVARIETGAIALRFEGLEPDVRARPALLVLGRHRDRLESLAPRNALRRS